MAWHEGLRRRLLKQVVYPVERTHWEEDGRAAEIARHIASRLPPRALAGREETVHEELTLLVALYSAAARFGPCLGSEGAAVPSERDARAESWALTSISPHVMREGGLVLLDLARLLRPVDCAHRLPFAVPPRTSALFLPSVATAVAEQGWRPSSAVCPWCRSPVRGYDAQRAAFESSLLYCSFFECLIPDVPPPDPWDEDDSLFCVVTSAGLATRTLSDLALFRALLSRGWRPADVSSRPCRDPDTDDRGLEA